MTKNSLLQTMKRCQHENRETKSSKNVVCERTGKHLLDGCPVVELRHATVTHCGSRFGKLPLPERFAVFGTFVGNQTDDNQSDY